MNMDNYHQTAFAGNGTVIMEYGSIFIQAKKISAEWR